MDGDPDTGAIRHILVVDDSRLQRRILAASLKRRGYQITEADSAEAALKACETMRPDLVLSDWMMPGLSGPEFCRSYRELPGDEYGYFILLTSKNETNDITEGLAAGADDFLTKPVNAGELQARILAGERIVSMQRELSAKNRMITDTLSELQGVYDSIDADLVQAKKIQESLIPDLSRTFGTSRVSLLMKPCGHIGGDLVGMFSPGSNRLGFYSIDVSGHGITSAMMTARLGGYLSSHHFEENVALERRFEEFFALKPPSEVAEILNNRLNADTGIDEYFTMAYAVVDLRSGRVKLVQAGHPHPLLIRANGEHEFVGTGGMPIGLIPSVSFEQVDFYMQPGDRLLLYSDGITEFERADGSMIEENGLLDLIAGGDGPQCGLEFLNDLYWNLTQEMAPGQKLTDDISAAMLCFDRS